MSAGTAIKRTSVALGQSPRSAKLQRSARVFQLLNLTPDSARMLSAIHEAGHVVVANTVGALVISTSVTSREHIGVDGADETVLDMPGGRAMTLAEQLPILAAGFQASFLWLGTRRIGETVRNQALNILAAGDWEDCVQACVDAGRPDLGMQDGVLPAAQVLQARWSTVVRIACDLARMGSMTHPDLWPHLIDEARTGRRTALAAYETWRTEFTRSL